MDDNRGNKNIRKAPLPTGKGGVSIPIRHANGPPRMKYEVPPGGNAPESVSQSAYEIATLLKLLEVDGNMLKQHAYSGACMEIYKRVRKAIRRLDSNSGDWRIIMGSRRQAPEPIFFLSSNVVAVGGEFSWLEVLRLAESLIGITTSVDSVDSAVTADEPLRATRAETCPALSQAVSDVEAPSTTLAIGGDDEPPSLEEWEHLPVFSGSRPDPVVPQDDPVAAAQRVECLPALQTGTITDFIVKFVKSTRLRHVDIRLIASEWYSAVLDGVSGRQADFRSTSLPYLVRKAGKSPGTGPCFGFSGSARIRQEFLLRYWDQHCGPGKVNLDPFGWLNGLPSDPPEPEGGVRL
jgi:hypothetical protein